MLKKPSGRSVKSNQRAQKLAREVRHLISEDGIITGANGNKLLELLSSWMRVTGKVKYERP